MKRLPPGEELVGAQRSVVAIAGNASVVLSHSALATAAVGETRRLRAASTDHLRMEETVWNFDADDAENIPAVSGAALAELEQQGMRVVEGPTIKEVDTLGGPRWSVSFLVESPIES